MLNAVFADIRSPEYLRKLLDETRKLTGTVEHAPAKNLRAQATKLRQQIERLIDLALEAAETGPYQRKADDLEKQLKSLTTEIERVQGEHNLTAATKEITGDQIMEILAPWRMNSTKTTT